MERACSEMHERISSGDIHSIIVIVQAQGDPAPHTVVMGRYSHDLFRAMAALERGRIELHRLLDSIEAREWASSSA